jgi:hypothetical protein
MNSDVTNYQSIPRHLFSIGGLLMFFVCLVPLKSYSTFSAVLWNLAVSLPLKQIFVNLTHVMTPSLTFYYCTLCILPRCAFKCNDMFLLCRDSPVNVLAGNPQWSPKNERFLEANFPMGWDVSMRLPKALPWPKSRRLTYICGTWALGVGCAFAEQNTGKKLHHDKFTHMGSRDPPINHYELLPTWCSCGSTGGARGRATPSESLATPLSPHLLGASGA